MSGLWKSRQKAIHKEMVTRLKPLERDLGDAEEVAQELWDQVISFDTSRSATRLRRRISAALGRFNMAGGELIVLTEKGLRRRDWSKPDPAEVGDVHVDLTRLYAWLRGRLPRTEDGFEIMQVVSTVIES